MSADLFVDYLIGVGPEIDAALHDYLDIGSKESPLQRYLYGILDEFISRGGKRVRPAMAMLACSATGGDPHKALTGGCAVEVFHVAALLHDDIMDDSLLRREQPCAHILHGIPLTINAGDYALGLVCTVVVRDPLLTDSVKIAVLDTIGEMSARTVEGQALDVGWVRDNVYNLTPDDYFVMALCKTGYYSGIAPLKIGGIIAGAGDDEIEALVGFGKNSSIAFQIQDDLLNILGDERTMGKDYLSDIFEGKRTLMAIHCLTEASPADKERLIGLLRGGQDKSRERAAEVLTLMQKYGSVDYARSYAHNLIREACTYLAALPNSKSRDILASMADFFLEREK